MSALRLSTWSFLGATLLAATPAEAQPTSGWFADGPSASSAAGSATAPEDPRQVASAALERLQNGQGGSAAADRSADPSAAAWDWGWDEEPAGEDDPFADGIDPDVIDDAQGFDLRETEVPESVRDRVERETYDEPPPRYSTESLPTGEDRSAVTPQVIPTPAGEGKIEGMGESFAPQLNTGTATFSVPIALPPGRGGAQPGLALGYSSSGGNGPLGIGWDLAVPYIARQIDKGMPTYVDPSGGLANDRFKYNGGQELVQITEPAPDERFWSTGGGPGGIGSDVPGPGGSSSAIPTGWLYFRARVEGAFLRFFMREDGRQWRVQDKNGTWFEFGAVEDPDVPLAETEASLVDFSLDGRTVVYRWNLTRMTDANGNEVWYFYGKNGNQSYLTDVLWNSPAPSGSGNPRTTYQHHVQLAYDTTGRRDVLTGYAAGFPITTAWRIRQIIVESVHFGDAPGARSHTRTYLFTYDPSSYLSLLTQVQLFGKGCLATPVSGGSVTIPSGCTVAAGGALPPLTLGYTEVASGEWADGFGYISDTVETFAASPDRSIDDDRTDLFDANRDGLPDLLITDPARCSGGHCLWLNETDGSGNVSFVRGDDIDLPGSIGADFTMSNTNVNPLEMDGDGAVEWMHMPHRLTYRYFRLEHDLPTATYGETFWRDGYRWQEYGPFDPGTVDADIDFTRDADDIRLVDLNNDHLVDVVRTTGTAMQHWLNLTRCGPDFEGRFGTPVIDSRGQCIDAETDGSGRDVPISTCVLHRGMPIQFSNGDTRLADMNGDGLQDIVHLRSGGIAYWPGRGYVAGADGQMFWGVSADRESCEAGTYGPDLEQTMTNSPRILTIEDDARVMMADVNGDGLSDLVQVRFDAVDVWLNLGGTAWSDRVILDGVPYHPGIVNRIRVADVNGSTTTDVMWGTARSYQFLDFTGGIQPRLLVSVENGMGKTSEIAYRSSTAYGAEAREADQPWTSFAPFPSQVVASSTVRDGLGAEHVTEYKYQNAYYDGWEAEFRGFGEARVKTVGDANSPTSVSITRFEPGLKPDWVCDDLPLGLLDPDCRYVENPLEALKGAVTSTETCDEAAWTDVNAAICQGAATSRYSVRKLYAPGFSDRSVWYAYARTSYSWVYDTSVVQGTHVADPSVVGGYDVYTGANETSPEMGDGDWPLLTPPLSAGQKYTLKSETPDVDFWGNVKETVNHGALELSGDEVTTRAEYHAGLMTSRYIHRVSRSYTLDGGTALADTLTEYATPGRCNHLPSAVRVAGSNPDTWDPPTDPPTDSEGRFELVRSNVIYDEARFCQPVQTCSGGLCGAAPLGQAWVKYDDQYAAFPTHETIDVSSPGNTAYDQPTADPPVTSFSGDGRAFLVTSATWYAEYGAIATATDPSGLTTSVTLDNLGRPVRMYRPGCGEPAAEIAYHLGSPVSYVHTRTNETCQPESTAAITGDAMEAYAYVDGMGRARGAISEGSATDLLPGILSGVQAFDAKGAVQRAYLPCATGFPPPEHVTTVPGCSGAAPLYARSAYDPFGRVTRAWTTDGTEVVATRYGALVTDVWDAGDLAPGLYHGTPATTYVDGLGRTVRTVERNRSEDDPAVETFATELVYNPLGAVVEMTRGRVSGDQRSSSFSGGEFVVKTQIYDTLGRRVTNDDPDAGIYRYAYDAVDRLIATHDARAVTNRYWYDRGGRLVAEDLDDDVPYTPTSWETAGGAAGHTCTSDPPPDGVCFDVVYGFDQPYLRSDHDWDDPMPASQGPLAGRPSWTRDRAGTVVLGYDPHGWAVWSGRQIAPDVTNGYFSQSTFDEGQRLLTESNPDTSWFQYHYTTRGLLEWVWFYDSDDTDRPLVRQTRYDVQGRKVRVFYGDQLCTLPDGSTCDPSVGGDCTCRDEGTEETYTYDSRQRLARKRAVRADDLVLLDYRYMYDSASNIVRIDDGRIPCWVANAASVDPAATCPAPGPDVNRFVTYDITYSYDALYRLTKATPLYKLPEEDRVGEQRWSFDALGSMQTWTDPADHFYGWSLGSIVNGLQVGSDPGLGPLPEDPYHACQVDILGKCVAPRLTPAPHALYAATSTTGDDELAAFYDAAGNMAALVVHRPRGCEQENGTGGPDGLDCKEGDDFALFFAWDEVGNLIAADRRTPVVTDSATAPPQPDCTLDPDPLPFLGVTTGQYVWWCPAASLQSAYDFGNQRRVKVETYHDGNPWDFADGYSLYVSANYEKRNVEYDDPSSTYGGESLIHARYARDGLATTWELDSLGPDGTDSGKYRLTLTNHLSSIGIVLDAAIGAPLRHFSQLPYGAEEKVVAPVGWEAKDVGRYEFTGKERDRGVGLTYFGARSLDARLGRWAIADPLVVVAPVPPPGQANAYMLAAARPVALPDPVGLSVPVVDMQNQSTPRAVLTAGLDGSSPYSLDTVGARSVATAFNTQAANVGTRVLEDAALYGLNAEQVLDAEAVEAFQRSAAEGEFTQFGITDRTPLSESLIRLLANSFTAVGGFVEETSAASWAERLLGSQEDYMAGEFRADLAMVRSEYAYVVGLTSATHPQGGAGHPGTFQDPEPLTIGAQKHHVTAWATLERATLQASPGQGAAYLYEELFLHAFAGLEHAPANQPARVYPVDQMLAQYEFITWHPRKAVQIGLESTGEGNPFARHSAAVRQQIWNETNISETLRAVAAGGR